MATRSVGTGDAAADQKNTVTPIVVAAATSPRNASEFRFAP
jgi:hypothetical protein